MASKRNMDYLKKRFEISTANHDPFGIVNSSDLLGDAYVSSGKYETGIEYYEKSLEIYSEINHLSGRIESNLKLGNTHYKLAQYQTAIKYSKNSLEISTIIGNPSGIANSNCLWGIIYCCIGKYKEAIDCFNESLKIFTAIGDQSGIANNNGNLGNAYCNLGEYQKAIKYYEKDLEISSATGDQSGIASNNSNLGSIYRNFGEYQKAIKYYEKGLEICSANGDQSALAGNNANLGNAYLLLGEYQKAIRYYEKSLEISTATGNRSEIGRNNGNLGNVCLSLGEYQKAIQYFKKSLDIGSAIGDQSAIAGNNGNLGNAYYNMGEYQKAIKYYEKGLEISSLIGRQSGIASNNGNLGNIYRRLGDYQKAIKYFENGLQINSAIGDQSGIATNNGNLGNAYLCLGEYQKAIKYGEKGLKINCAIGNQSGIATNNGNLGVIYRSLGEYEKAIKYFEKSLEISSAIGDQLGIACQNSNLGYTYLILEEYQKAIKYYKIGLEISCAIGDQSGIASQNINLGNAYLSLGEHKDARSHLEEAIRVYDKIFLKFVPDRNKLSFTPQYFITHRLLMSCFLYLERAKSALLVFDLGKAKELHFCIEKYKNCAATEVNDFARTTWNRIRACEEEIEIEEIQQILQMGKNDTSILVYAFDHKGFLNIWVLNEDFFFRKVDAASETIFTLIREFFEMVNVIVNRTSSFQENNVSVVSTVNPVNSPFGSLSRKPQHESVVKKNSKKISKELFQLLIDPVKNSLKGNKLIVVPDRLLFFASFSSFVDENDRFLTSKYSIQITPSLHTLKASMQRAHDLNIGFAFFIGNPTVGEISLNGEEFTPRSLTGAAKEVEYLASLFDATPLLGRKARKQVVMELLGKSSIIHIAAHAESQKGEIILAPNSSHDQPNLESFLLTQEDIQSISVQARLVVLCCCYTGQGEVSSEGVIGITRSFLAAGTRSVLATLWPINDMATMEFMKKFYHELLEETPVCEALRRAKNFFQEHENNTYQSIRIWAPFTIYGEDVKFEKQEIEEIREKSREFFDGFVVLP